MAQPNLAWTLAIIALAIVLILVGGLLGGILAVYLGQPP